MIDTEDMHVLHSITLPKFVKFEFPTYYFTPIVKEDIGFTLIKGIVKNRFGELKFQFTVNVENQLPYLLQGPPNNIILNVGSYTKISLGEIIDQEND